MAFHCDFCKKKYAKSYRDNRKACSVESKKPVFEYKDRIKYYRCPANFVDMSIVHYMTVNKHFRNGIMPFSGTLMEQPNKLIEILELIESLLNEIESEKSRKEDKKWQTTKSKSR